MNEFDGMLKINIYPNIEIELDEECEPPLLDRCDKKTNEVMNQIIREKDDSNKSFS